MPSGHSGRVETILPHLALMTLMDEISFHFSAPGVNKADFTAWKQQRKKPKQCLQIGRMSAGAEISKGRREISLQTPSVSNDDWPQSHRDAKCTWVSFVERPKVRPGWWEKLLEGSTPRRCGQE